MKKIKILATCIFMLLAYSSTLEAQTNTKKLSDPSVVRYIVGGFTKEQKIHLTANADYETLSLQQKQDILNKVAQEFVGYDISVYLGGQERELWLADGNSVLYIEKWNNDSLKIEDYMPLELKRDGDTKVFYYVGGSFSGGDEYSSGNLNLRLGSYLYKNLIDASATLNLGYNKSDKESKFAGDVGVDSRAYLPFRIKNVNLSPYAGAGVSYSFSPDTYFELRLLAGACWFVGPGSLDIGVQYGTKSDLSLTLGYTFRFTGKKKTKK